MSRSRTTSTRILASDLRRSEVVSLPLALILLVIVFTTGVAALLCLGVGIFAVLGGVGAALALAHVFDVSTYAVNVVTLVGLGIAIDYSLFIVTRFREELGNGLSVEDALATTMATAGRAIMFSGLTVAIGLSGLLFYTGTALVSMGVAGAIVVAISVLYGVTLLPALLAILGRRINSMRIPILQPKPFGQGAWHRLATWVMRRPWLVLIPTVAILLVAGSPFLDLQLANSDVNQLPMNAEARQGADLLQRQFPQVGTNTIAVVIDFDHGAPTSPANVATAYALSQRLAGAAGSHLDPQLRDGRSHHNARRISVDVCATEGRTAVGGAVVAHQPDGLEHRGARRRQPVLRDERPSACAGSADPRRRTRCPAPR